MLLATLVAGMLTSEGHASFERQRDLDASGSHYTLFNLSSGEIIPIADSATNRWDIGFKGTTIILNGGISGPGSVTGQVMQTDFNDLMVAPASGYASDDASGLAVPSGTGNGWYNYVGPPTHIIEPIDGRTVVVQTNNGNFAKISLTSYYAGNPDLSQYTVHPPFEPSSHYTFRYFVQPDGSDNLDHTGKRGHFDLPSTGANGHFTFFNLSLGDSVPVSDSASANWDFAFRGTTIILNSGISGPSSVSGQMMYQNFNDITIAPTSGYDSDDANGLAIPTGSNNGWYEYAGHPTHKIEPIPNSTILMQLADGRYAKVAIISYYEGNPDLTQYVNSPPVEASRHYTFKYFIQNDGTT
ncbi:MAG: HmuY family protein, partial [Bacteroidota bacterium]